jgi:hypothetical protein
MTLMKFGAWPHLNVDSIITNFPQAARKSLEAGA